MRAAGDPSEVPQRETQIGRVARCLSLRKCRALANFCAKSPGTSSHMGREPPIRVGIVEDHPAYLFALTELVERSARATCAFAAGSARQGGDALAVPADVVLLDVALPDADGLTVLRAARDLDVPTRFLLLSGHCRGDLIEEALRLGAAGFLTKDAHLEDIEVAI